MKNRIQILLIGIGLLVVLGILVYFLYKKIYEHQINKILENKKQRKMISVQNLLKIYISISVLILFVFIVNISSAKTPEACKIDGYISLIEQDEQEVKNILYDNLKDASSESYSLQEQKMDEQITLYFAANKDTYAYALRFTLNRAPQEEEVLNIDMDGASSSIKASDIKGSSFYITVTGNKTKHDCASIQRNIHIHNFTVGKNEKPININEKIIIENGGIHQ